MPRVISGTARGRRLSTPEGLTTRPTSDRVKEAMFSSLSARMPLESASVLDLYAGSGQLGIEALSRGAAHVIFIEQRRASVQTIRENLQICGFAQQAEVLLGEALHQTERLARSGAQFDLLLADPPYAMADAVLRRLDELLGSYHFLTPQGLLLLEYADRALSRQGHAKADEGKEPALRNLVDVRSCQYGGTMVSFYRYNDGVD